MNSVCGPEGERSTRNLGVSDFGPGAAGTDHRQVVLAEVLFPNPGNGAALAHAADIEPHPNAIHHHEHQTQQAPPREIVHGDIVRQRSHAQAVERIRLGLRPTTWADARRWVNHRVSLDRGESGAQVVGSVIRSYSCTWWTDWRG